MICLACLGLLIALAGVRAAVAERGRTDVLITLVVCSGMALACVYDARSMSRSVPAAGSFAIFCAWPVAVPIYLVWSRGWRRGMLWAMAYMASLAVLYLVPYFAAGCAVRGAAFFKTG